ncbi:MAG TPA: hypothetical protein VK994_02220 [Bacteroidales bacterium]|nr:hypothetical protein [Bacteroidales bacterium]
MRKMITLFAMIIATAIIAFGQDDYKMLQLVYLKPLPGADMEAAEKAIAAHNKKFHAEDPYKASVWANYTGSMVGTWVWAMYPATFTDFDKRENMEDHDKDWDHATQYFEVVANEYWRVDDKISYTPENFKEGSKVIWTIFDVKPGDSYRFKALLENIAEVYKQKKYPKNFTVYWNRFENKMGRDVAIEVMFDKWAFFDEDNNMKKDYEEVHGEGSWWKAIEEYRDVVESAEDEVSIHLKSMSSK